MRLGRSVWRQEYESVERPMYQDKDSQKNLLIAIVLSVAVLLGWQVFYASPKL